MEYFIQHAGVIFVVLLTMALIILHFNKKADINLFDLVTRDGKLSTTKILQVVGGFVATWVVIKLTVGDKITWDIFTIYLAYVASVEGFSKVVALKFGDKNASGDTYSTQDSVTKTGSAKTPEE